MKTEELKAKGLTDEQISFVMAEHGKGLTKLQNDNAALTAERDEWKGKAETAEGTLKNFEGIDPQNIQKELDDWKTKYSDLEKKSKEEKEKRDFNEALKTALENVKFSSEAARKAIMAEISEAGLKTRDGKILGLNDLLDSIKAKDATAFVDKNKDEKKARFAGRSNEGGNEKYTMSELMKMANEGTDTSAYI